jgi:hypothetical protein
MIRTSESVAKLSAALVTAQAEMPGAPKSAKGQVGNQTRYYADMAAVVEAARPVLAKHELAYTQFPSGFAGGCVTVTTRLLHTSGEWMEAELDMPTGGSGAQAVGSAITYAKRYALMAVLGMPTEDDDGSAATAASKPAARKSAPPAAPPAVAEPDDPNKISAAQTKKMMASFNDIGLRSREDRLAFIAATARAVGSSQDLTHAEASDVIDAIAKCIAGKLAIVWTGEGQMNVIAKAAS